MKRIGIVLSLFIILAACKNTEATKADSVCRLNGKSTNVNVKLCAYDEELFRFEKNSEIKYRDYGYDKKTAQDIVDLQRAAYSEYDYITYKTLVDEMKIHEYITVDMRFADYDVLDELKLIDVKNMSYISKTTVEESYENMGFTCTSTR